MKCDFYLYKRIFYKKKYFLDIYNFLLELKSIFFNINLMVINM